MGHEVDNNTNRDWSFWYSHQMIIKGTGGLGGRRMSGNPSATTLLRTARIMRRVLGS